MVEKTDLQIKLEKGLLKAGDLLDKVGLDFMLIGGTLLGVVRDGGIFAHDFDTDVAVLVEDITPEIKKKIKAVDWFKAESACDAGETGEMSLTVEGRSIDIFPLNKKGDIRFFNAVHNKCLVWPAHLFDNKEEWGDVEYLGRKWKTPTNRIEYFRVMYGDKWYIPDKKFRWQDAPNFKLYEDL